MQEINRIIIPLTNTSPGRPILSLAWSGDDLVDWAKGGIRIALDNTTKDPHRGYSYRFDHAIISPSQDYTVLYERLGTKGLLLRKNGEIIRELNRSFYHAYTYEYPIAFLTLPDGRTAIAHCPDTYEKIEIEEVETEERLTSRDTPPDDFFHSRLAVSPNNRYLLSAGWLWHPWDCIQVYDLTKVYSEPVLLDVFDRRFFNLDGAEAEITNAAFQSENIIILTTSYVDYNLEEDEKGKQGLLEPREIVVYDLATEQIISHAPLQEPAGTLMPVGEDFVVSFYEHPKLINLKTGEVAIRWPDIASGQQDGSIIHHIPKLPPIALDTPNKRFAVASQEHIIIIELG